MYGIKNDMQNQGHNEKMGWIKKLDLFRSIPTEVLHSLQLLDTKINSDHFIPEIPELLNRSVLKGGKKFRPLLCFLMGKVFGLEPKIIAPYARITEFTHSATLAHDDVIDQSDRRRNNHTINSMTSNARAVLAGDFLLASAVSELCQLGNLQIVQDLSKVLVELVDGEWLQLKVKGNIEASQQNLEWIAQKKTSSIISWCCMIPARILELPAPILDKCAGFGTSLGMAFQMVDDILDFEENSQKPVGLDFQNGNLNYVSVAMLRENPELLPAFTESFGKKDWEQWPWSAEQLNAAKSVVRDRARYFVGKGKTQLKEIVQMSPAAINKDSQMVAVNSLTQLLDILVSRTY